MRTSIVLLLVLVVSSPAWALPPTQESSGDDDDARVTLTLQREFITGDSHSLCSVRVRDAGSDVALTAGDWIRVEVLEHDFLGVGNDEIWSERFDVSAQEVAAGSVDRTFDCTASFGDDPGDLIEVFAQAHVEKSECGFWCNQDDARTDNLEHACSDSGPTMT